MLVVHRVPIDYLTKVHMKRALQSALGLLVKNTEPGLYSSELISGKRGGRRNEMGCKRQIERQNEGKRKNKKRTNADVRGGEGEGEMYLTS